MPSSFNPVEFANETIVRQIKVDSIFTGYRIQSNANNEITLALSSEALLAALRSASSSASSSSSYETEEVVMKLAKKNDQAVLSFEISGMTRVGRKVRVAHDVRIEVMKPSDVARLAEPLCPEPDVSPSWRLSCTSLDQAISWQVHILLPPLQKLRTIVDRLRPMSDILAIKASNNGKLQLTISTDSVTVDTQWTDCTNPKMGMFFWRSICIRLDGWSTHNFLLQRMITHLNLKTPTQKQMKSQIQITSSQFLSQSAASLNFSIVMWSRPQP